MAAQSSSALFLSDFIPSKLFLLELKPKPSFLAKPLVTTPVCVFQNPDPKPPTTDLPLHPLLRAIPDWADRVQERGMRKRRSLYDHSDWILHRSSLRHIRHLLSSFSSRVVLSLVPPVLAFTSVAVFIATYNTAVELELLPTFFPVLRASSLPYQLTAPALALLLVFRTEASYSRFEGGKKAWTQVMATTNDLATKVISSTGNSSDKLIRNALLQYIMSFPVALKVPSPFFSSIGHGSSAGVSTETRHVLLRAVSCDSWLRCRERSEGST